MDDFDTDWGDMDGLSMDGMGDIGLTFEQDLLNLPPVAGDLDVGALPNLEMPESALGSQHAQKDTEQCNLVLGANVPRWPGQNNLGRADSQMPCQKKWGAEGEGSMWLNGSPGSAASSSASSLFGSPLSSPPGTSLGGSPSGSSLSNQSSLPSTPQKPQASFPKGRKERAPPKKAAAEKKPKKSRADYDRAYRQKQKAKAEKGEDSERVIGELQEKLERADRQVVILVGAISEAINHIDPDRSPQAGECCMRLRGLLHQANHLLPPTHAHPPNPAHPSLTQPLGHRPVQLHAHLISFLFPLCFLLITGLSSMVYGEASSQSGQVEVVRSARHSRPPSSNPGRARPSVIRAGPPAHPSLALEAPAKLGGDPTPQPAEAARTKLLGYRTEAEGFRKKVKAERVQPPIGPSQDEEGNKIIHSSMDAITLKSLLIRLKTFNPVRVEPMPDMLPSEDDAIVPVQIYLHTDTSQLHLADGALTASDMHDAFIRRHLNQPSVVGSLAAATEAVAFRTRPT